MLHSPQEFTKMAMRASCFLCHALLPSWIPAGQLACFMTLLQHIVAKGHFQKLFLLSIWTQGPKLMGEGGVVM